MASNGTLTVPDTPNQDRRMSQPEEIESKVRIVLGNDDHLNEMDIEHIIRAMQSLECLGTQSYIRVEDLYKVFQHCKFNVNPELIDQKLKILDIQSQQVFKSSLERGNKVAAKLKKMKGNSEPDELVDEGISLADFSKLYMHLKNMMLNSGLTEMEMFGVEVVEDKFQYQNTGGSRRISMERSMFTGEHSKSERSAFAIYINSRLKDDEFFKRYAPIDPSDENELFEKCSDGVIFCRLLKKIRNSLIHDKCINQFERKDSKRKVNIHEANAVKFNSIQDLKVITQKIENMNLAIYTAASIGCNTIKTDISQIILKHNPIAILGFLWEVIKTQLYMKIDLEKTKAIYDRLDLMMPECNHQDLLYSMGPEEILLMWLNYQMQSNPKCPTYITTEEVKERGKIEVIEHVHKIEKFNFDEDLTDCVAYQLMLEQLQLIEVQANPNFEEKDIVYSNFEKNKNPQSRALHTLKMADALGGKFFLTWKDIIEGNPKLAKAFIANLFNTKMHLFRPGEIGVVEDGPEEYIESKEEAKLKNWMNSLNLRSTVNYLYTDLRDGIVLLKIIDRIVPNVVKWKKVHFPPFEKEMHPCENCDYAIKLLADKKNNIKVKLGSVRGHNIYTADPKNITLGLLKQLMRAYSLAMLNAVSDGSDGEDLDSDDIILSWINECIQFEEDKVETLADQKLKSGQALADCLNKIAKLRRSEKYIECSAVAHSAKSILLENAIYLLGTARKFGAHTYVLPENIAKVDSAMLRCLFISLMVIERQLQRGVFTEVEAEALKAEQAIVGKAKLQDEIEFEKED